MVVECLTEDHRWEALAPDPSGAGPLSLEALAETVVTATLVRLGLDPAMFEISLLGCNDTRIAELNADFRGKPQPTNVLSWPSDERGAEVPGKMPLAPELSEEGPTGLGDIAIAYETCATEATQAGKSLIDHTTHLIVHGTLHLLGFDHERDPDAKLMEGLETEILGKLGIADPYAL
jgi:probable rRNA maturation factor